MIHIHVDTSIFNNIISKEMILTRIFDVLKLNMMRLY